MCSDRRGCSISMQKQQHVEPSEHLPGLSDDVGAGFISGYGAQPVSGSDLNVDRLVELPLQDEIGSLGISKVIRADQKRFFFDLGSNNRGHFLRISEVLALVQFFYFSIIVLQLCYVLAYYVGCWSRSFVYNPSLVWVEAIL